MKNNYLPFGSVRNTNLAPASTRYFVKLAIGSRLRSIVFSCLSMLLLFTRCQPIAGEAPQPLASPNAAVTLQTVTSVAGMVAQAECVTEVSPTGELTLICVPLDWNGELILYAPGYTPAFEALHLAPEASTYGQLFTLAGYAFATTSYSENGLAVQTGIQDIIRLRNKFIQTYGEPEEIYLTGASEGGLITTLALERHPDLWSGGISLCGPCGDFQRQINYYGNFRVLFDYFYPGVLPGNVVDFPDEMLFNWPAYVQAITAAVVSNPAKAALLLNVAQAPYDPDNPATLVQTVVGVLTYNLFIRDAVEKLGGNPFDNTRTVFSGTGSAAGDQLLNSTVQRYEGDKEALKNIKKFYETSGNIKKPLVKSHTTLDPIDLFWHMPLYEAKVPPGKRSLLATIPVASYGHCNFTQQEILFIFMQMLQKVNAQKQHPLAKVKGAAGTVIKSVTTEPILAKAK